MSFDSTKIRDHVNETDFTMLCNQLVCNSCVSLVLAYRWVVKDGKCSLRVLGRSDSTTWYRSCETAVLVYSVCANFKKGKNVKITCYVVSLSLGRNSCVLRGDHRNISLTVTARTGSFNDRTLVIVVKSPSTVERVERLASRLSR